SPRRERVALEAQDEGEEIERERQEPQERDRGDLLTDLVRRGEEHERTATGEGEPEQREEPGRLRRVGSGRVGGRSRPRVRRSRAPSAERRARREDSVSPRPRGGLCAEPQGRLDEERIRQRREQRSRVRERVEPVNVASASTAARTRPGGPRLKQRA